MNLFESARVKLTLWYLVIIMAISLFFSVLIFVFVSREIQNNLDRIFLRMHADELGIPVPPNGRMFMRGNIPEKLQELEGNFLEEASESKKNVALILFEINGIIFVTTSALGYVLAGKTLKPVENALLEQKRFIADASHELRTPLTAMKTTTEVSLRDKNLTVKEARSILKDNLAEIDSMKHLTDDLLILANLEKERRNDFEVVDIGKLVKKTSESMQGMAGAKKLNLKIKTMHINANVIPEMIERLTRNLVDNAIKYTEKGSVTITLVKKGKNVVLKVSDSGIGISKDKIEHIFERFFRTDEARSKHVGNGYGIGLSIAKKIVKNHKGKIEVESILGKGTCFTVFLPIS